MKIEKVEQSKHVKDRFLIFLADGNLLKVTQKEVLTFSLYTGKELDEDTLKELQAAAGTSGARARAAAIIGSRALSRKELIERLVKKGETEENAVDAADWLERIGALDDAAYAAALVRHYSTMSYGPAKLRNELYRRGVPRELWDDAVSTAPAAEDAIEKYIASKLRGRRPDEKELKRLSDGLLRRGFRWGDIHSALQRYEEYLQGEE